MGDDETTEEKVFDSDEDYLLDDQEDDDGLCGYCELPWDGVFCTRCGYTA